MADPLNPAVPGATVSPFPPDLQVQAQQIARRRAIADMLMMRAMQPAHQPTGYGGQPVPMSPFAGLAPLVGGVLAARGLGKADEASADLTKKYSTGLAAARAAMLERIKVGDLAGANEIGGPWPALSHLSDAAALQTLPKREVTEQFDPKTGRPQKVVANVNDPNAPVVPLGGIKEPNFQKVETTTPTGQPATSFVDPSVAAGQPPIPAPVKNVGENLGGTTQMVNPYGPERTLPHTIDPNKIPAEQDIEADAKMIAEYRKPGYATSGGRAQPWQVNVMRRVDQLTNHTYDASVFPVVKSAEVEFNQKNAPQVRAFGTLVGHVQAAKELYTALGNPTDVTRLNAARNFFLEEFGYPAPAALDTARPFIAAEAVKAVTGGPGAVEDRKIMAERFSKAQSPEAFNAAADTVIKYGAEQLKGHLQQLKGMTKGKRAEEDFVQYLTPQARQAFFAAGGGERRKGPQSGVAVPPAAQGGGVNLPSQSDIDAELKRRGL